LDVVRLRVIVGPTAAGKSAIALALARQSDVTIISADSRQLYRGFDVGTAKPSADERAIVPHQGVDIADPTERFNAARWAAMAERWIDAALAADRVPLVVGGTGFYIRALFQPLFEEPALDAGAREEAAGDLRGLETRDLRSMVLTIDPERAHLGRTQLLRALEVFRLTGTPMSEWHRRSARPPRFAGRYLQVDAMRTLSDRIERRVQDMLAQGWEQEVRQLASVVPGSAPAWNATGYESMRRVVAGELRLDDASARIVTATRQYAKRQRTWCRNQLPGERVTVLDSDEDEVMARALRWWRDEERL
jgi:tRNA dimethylallyltransferase